MNNLLKKHKNVLAGIGAVVILFVLYSIFFVSDDREGDVLVSNTPAGATATVERELLDLLFELRAVELDESIFTDATFQSLADFGRELDSELVGRPNPFADIEEQ